MRKFLWSTFVFTALSVVVQYLLDTFYPLDGGTPPDISLSQLTNIDALLNDPVALNALQQQVSLTGGASLSRMVTVTIITLCLLMIWPALRDGITIWLLRRRGLRWEKNTRFLNIVHAGDAMLPDDNPLLLKPNDHVVKNFVWRGVNVSDRPLTGLDGFVRAGKTKQDYPLLLDGQPLTPHSRIAPGQAFLLTALFRQDGKPPVTTKDFLKRIGAVDFVFYYNGQRYKRRFTPERIALALRNRL